MVQRKVTVQAPEGLHARPAALFVQAATKAPAAVTIAKDGKDPVSARSILAVLSLDVRTGEEVVLEADGADADAALDTLAALLAAEHPAAEAAPGTAPDA
jgi:phosphocarrier protein